MDTQTRVPSDTSEGAQQSGKTNLLMMLIAQSERIDEAVAAGLLTEDEAQRLRAGDMTWQRE